MSVWKGWNAKIYKDGSQIGYADSASLEITSNLDPFFQIGSRQAVAITEGNEEITGSFSKAWVNNTYLSLVSDTGALTDFTLSFEIGSTPAVTVYCYNCKFASGSLDIPQDGVLKEDYDFQALTVSFSSA